MNKIHHPEQYLQWQIQQCQKHGIDRIPSIATTIEFLQINPHDLSLREFLDNAIHTAQQEQLFNPNPFTATSPVSESQFTGTILLGKIPKYNIPYCIQPSQLLTHMLNCSRSGGGKTNLNLLLIAQILEQGNKSTFIFERQPEYHALIKYENFVYWMFQDFYINILKPAPNVPFKNWINIILEIFGNFLDIRVASRNLLASKILWLSEQPNYLPMGRYPTLKDVYQTILNTKYPGYSNLARHKETILNRLDGIFTVFGDNLSSHRSLKWNTFIHSNWAISLNGIPTDYQNLFISTITALIMTYRMTNNLRSNKLEHLFVLDEASSMFKKQYEYRENTYLLSDYLARAREFGCGFLISTQSLSNLAESIIANTTTKIVTGGFGLGSDYDIYASATGLSNEHKQFLKQNTIPGLACVKDSRYNHPFLVEVPLVS